MSWFGKKHSSTQRWAGDLKSYPSSLPPTRGFAMVSWLRAGQKIELLLFSNPPSSMVHLKTPSGYLKVQELLCFSNTHTPLHLQEALDDFSVAHLPASITTLVLWDHYYVKSVLPEHKHCYLDS